MCRIENRAEQCREFTQKLLAPIEHSSSRNTRWSVWSLQSMVGAGHQNRHRSHRIRVNYRVRRVGRGLTLTEFRVRSFVPANFLQDNDRVTELVVQREGLLRIVTEVVDAGEFELGDSA